VRGNLGMCRLLLGVACLAQISGTAVARLMPRMVSECVPAFVCVESRGAAELSHEMTRTGSSSISDSRRSDSRRARPRDKDMMLHPPERKLKAVIQTVGEGLIDWWAGAGDMLRTALMIDPDISIQDGIQTGDATPWYKFPPPAAAELELGWGDPAGWSSSCRSARAWVGTCEGQPVNSEAVSAERRRRRARRLARNPHLILSEAEIRAWKQQKALKLAKSRSTGSQQRSDHSHHWDSSSSEAPQCSTCGEEVQGIWIMGFDKIHCSPMCREATEQAVLGGQVQDFVGVAKLFSHKKEEEDKARREREEHLKKVQIAARARDRNRDHDEWMMWDLPASGTAGGAQYVYCP